MLIRETRGVSPPSKSEGAADKLLAALVTEMPQYCNDKMIYCLKMKSSQVLLIY